MKFISELNMADPADAAEMKRHVFGQHYATDLRGRPIEASSIDAMVVNGRHPDRVEAHCQALGKASGADAEKAERARLDKLRAQASRSREQHADALSGETI